MKALSLDIETFSEVELKDSGVYAYAASPGFQILLLAYGFDEEEVRVIDLASGEKLPQEIVNALKDESIIKTSFNAQFERICLSKFLNTQLSPKGWHCTRVLAGSMGLPLFLEGVAQVLGLKEQKMKEGKDLIKFFCRPVMPSKDGEDIGTGTLSLVHSHRPSGSSLSKEKWETFKSYCKKDVEVERAIRKRLMKYALTEREQELYVLDQEINDRGVLVDMKLVTNAMTFHRLHKEEAFLRAKKITGLENPNSVPQLKKWLHEKGVDMDSLARKNVAKLSKEMDADVRELLNLRLELSKTSIKKYEAITKSVCLDERVRGLFQFYGANRTGRWAGRLVQVQNLPQNHMKDLTMARSLVKNGDFITLEMLFESVPQVLSELIRTAFIPKQGHNFIVADFSAIEARVLAYLAGESWRLKVFETHGKIYEASASRMFKVPMEEITKTSPLRQKGKIAELALGYGGSVGALSAMGALDMGVSIEELKKLVAVWRRSNQNITKFWWEIDRAVRRAVEEGHPSSVGKIGVYCERSILFIALPSGRRLSYIRPKVEMSRNKPGCEVVTYDGIGVSKKWERIETYGPKLTENIVQAVARDILAEAMLRLSRSGYSIVMHVHDEIVVEHEAGTDALREICESLKAAPAWAAGLPLHAEGFECEYYRKD